MSRRKKHQPDSAPLPATASVQPDSAPADLGNGHRTALKAALAWGVGLLAVSFLARLSYWWLIDNDSYFHLAAARHLADTLGTPESGRLAWARMSVMGEHWGDKEWLFHLYLIPFVRLLDPFIGGKLALSVLNGAQFGFIGYLGVRIAGKAGRWLPLVVLAASPVLLWRLEMIRPHNVSLLLILILAWAMSGYRWLGLGLASVAFPLFYTAWQVPGILGIGTFAMLWIFRKERPWPLLIVPSAGVAIGVLLHPHFPDNVVIWKIQNFDYFRFKDILNVGTEIYRLDPVSFLHSLGPAVVMALVMAMSGKPRRPAPVLGRAELVLGTYCLAFLALLLVVGRRFVEYAIPLLAIFLFVTVHHRFEAIETRRWFPVAAVAVFLSLAVGTQARDIRGGHHFHFPTREDFQHFRDVLPKGARVAAYWDDAELYAFAAPQALYLNVLDPVFVAAKDRDSAMQLERLIQSRLPDLPDALQQHFDSDYLAFRQAMAPALAARADADPRMELILEAGMHRLYRVRQDGPDNFIRDWQLDGLDVEGYEDYTVQRIIANGPVAYGPSGQIKAFVEAPSDWPAGRCWWAMRRRPESSQGTVKLSFSSAGPSQVYLDEQKVLDTDGQEAAIIGWRSSVADYRMVAVRTCPGEIGTGFFWQESPVPE